MTFLSISSSVSLKYLGVGDVKSKIMRYTANFEYNVNVNNNVNDNVLILADLACSLPLGLALACYNMNFIGRALTSTSLLMVVLNSSQML